MTQAILSTLLLVFIGFIYILPAIIATKRSVRSSGGVTLLAIFTGWTIIGWVIALIWAVSGETQKEYELKYNR